MRFARPIERGIQRFAMVPPSTAMVRTRRFSTDASPPDLSSAFAAALLIAFEMMLAAFFGIRSSRPTAPSTDFLRTSAATTRILRGDIEIPRTSARACMALLLPLAGVTVERTGVRELAELVADHLLGDEDRDELAAVVDGEGQSDHLGNDHRTARVRRDDAARGVRLFGCNGHLLVKIGVDEGTFFR